MMTKRDEWEAGRLDPCEAFPGGAHRLHRKLCGNTWDISREAGACVDVPGKPLLVQDGVVCALCDPTQGVVVMPKDRDADAPIIIDRVAISWSEA